MDATSSSESAEIITLQAARAHLRLEDDYPAEQLQVYVTAACLSAQEFLNRRIYGGLADKAAAVDDLPAFLGEAMLAHSEALEAADLMADAGLRSSAREDAEASYRAARAAATEIRRGIVADDMVRAAILLTLGHLYANREDSVQGQVAELPNGCRALLQPYRIGMGV